METEGTLSGAWDQHLASEFAAKVLVQGVQTLGELVARRFDKRARNS